MNSCEGFWVAVGAGGPCGGKILAPAQNETVARNVKCKVAHILPIKMPLLLEAVPPAPPCLRRCGCRLLFWPLRAFLALASQSPPLYRQARAREGIADGRPQVAPLAARQDRLHRRRQVAAIGGAGRAAPGESANGALAAAPVRAVAVRGRCPQNCSTLPEGRRIQLVSPFWSL